MTYDQVRKKISQGEYVYTLHADIERKADDLAFYQIEDALLNGEIIEHYPDLGLGESCLILGFSQNIPIHIVCGWHGEKIAIITVYVPTPPKFIDPWTRRTEHGETNE